MSGDEVVNGSAQNVEIELRGPRPVVVTQLRLRSS